MSNTPWMVCRVDRESCQRCRQPIGRGEVCRRMRFGGVWCETCSSEVLAEAPPAKVPAPSFVEQLRESSARARATQPPASVVPTSSQPTVTRASLRPKPPHDPRMLAAGRDD